MKVLIVCRHKENFPRNCMPFITEQADAIAQVGEVEIDYFTVRGNALWSYFKVRDLKRKIKTFQPDLIHAHYGLSGFAAILQRQVPVVITFHNGETLSAKANFMSSVASLFAKHVIYVAQHIYDLCYLKPKTNYTILPCGVNLDQCVVVDQQQARQELGFAADKKYLLFGGAFANLRKNYPLLQHAIALLHRNDIEVLEMKGLDRATITKLMCACDLFALPSKSEGSPQALKEAMACNCPILATDVADIKHLLGNLDGHYLCSFEPADVADKLSKALADGRRTHGRERIMELGLENRKVAETILTIYNHIIARL